MKKILVVAVHPDDETLGCGGTLLKHKAAGDMIHWCIVTSVSKESGFSEDQVYAKEQEIKQAASRYGFDTVEHLNFPTTKLDQSPLEELIRRFSETIDRLEPNIIYLPFKYDVHSDHRVAFDATFSCTKNFRHPSITKILMMETLSETDFATALPAETFVPNYFVDISKFIDKKIEIASIYASEMGKHPFPRSETSIRALASLRGTAANCVAAESFMLLKEVS